MRKNILLLIVVTVSILSCENEIPYNLGIEKPKLIMNALINADSLENVIYLQFTGETELGYVADATLELRVNGELKESPLPMKDDYQGNRRFRIRNRFQPGDIVRIDARTGNGEHHAWIEETVPHPIEIINVDTATVTGYPSQYLYAEQRLRIKTTFTDTPGQKNYYRIVFEQRFSLKGKTASEKDSTFLTKSYDYWPWEDVVLTDGNPINPDELENNGMVEYIKNGYGIFDDSRFTDKQYTMTTQVSFTSYSYYWGQNFSLTHVSVDLVVRLLSITETEYYYFKVLNFLDSDMYDEFLSDPPKIPSNVHGGTGIVGFSTESSRLFNIVKDKELLYTY